MQLALGAVGAGIGSMFGFASIGWSIGSFIGGQLFGEKGQDIEGPRLTDKSVSGSSYGNMTPVIYGAYRVGGDLIWSTDLIEHANKEEAGKGGGGGGSYTSYTYTVSFAMQFCAGPAVGIRKIWFDSKLVYSSDSTSTIAELQAGGERIGNAKIYLGTETQTADPTMEAVEGVGNVPGYRGKVYMVFTDLDVTSYGNRIPQITAEVVVDGTLSLTGTQVTSGGASIRQSLTLKKGVARSFYYGYSYTGTDDSLGNLQGRSYSLVDLANKQTKTFRTLAAGDESLGWRYIAPVSMSPNGQWAIAEGGDVGTGANIQYYMLHIGDGGLLSKKLDIAGDLDNYRNADDVSFNIFWENDFNVWFYKFNSGEAYHWEIIQTAPGSFVIDQDSFIVDDTREGTDPIEDYGSFCMDRATGDLYFEVQTAGGTPQFSVKRFTRSGTFVEEKFIGTVWRSTRGRLLGFSNGVFWEVEGLTLKRFDWETEALLNSYAAATNATYIDGAVMEVSGNVATILAVGVMYHFYLSLASAGIGLDEVVSDICQRAGIAEADLDVTDLAADTVRGFLLAKQEPVRSALEQLSSAYFFDGVETDGVLKFVKRGGAVAATLDDSDIGCYEGDSVVELWEATRTQEEELPQAITLNYANVGADYQVGAQHSRRQVTLEGTSVTAQLSLALTDDEAKAIVDTWMYSAWQNRHKFKLNTWQKYAKLDPTDLISANGQTMRITDRAEGVNGLIELSAVREIPEIYTGQVGAGAASGHTDQSVVVRGPTVYKLMDIPPLRDADYNRYGMYWAACGLLADWSGAALLRSEDGTTWGVEMTNDNAAVIGQATTALGDWTGGNVFDERNVLRVNVTGTLETKTRLQVLNGANIALIGDELIQFRTATLVSTGVYDLTGLLRGRIGTEWAMDSHAEYEDFVLLDTNSTRFIDLESIDLNTQRTWGVVTYGDTIEDISTEYLTYTANNLKPLTPVHIGGGTTGLNTSWTIKWTDRSRYQWQWRDYFDVSEDEASDDFEVRILNGATVVRTISVTAAYTATYTNAQQVTDFGQHQLNLDVQVRKVGGFSSSDWSDVVSITSGLITYPGVSLLNFNGSNGSTTFTDVYTRTWTAAGNAQLSTTGAKYGSACLSLDGTGDYIYTATSGFALTTSDDFTVEMWVYPTSNTGLRALFSTRINASGSNLILRGNGGVVYYGSTPTSSGYTLLLNTWQHIALVRYLGTMYLYADGVLKSSVADSTAYPADNASEPVKVGNDWDAGAPFEGKIDDFRFSRFAQYTTAFTPPASELTE